VQYQLVAEASISNAKGRTSQKLRYQTLKDVRLKDQDGHLALAILFFSSGGRLPLCSGTIDFKFSLGTQLLSSQAGTES